MFDMICALFFLLVMIFGIVETVRILALSLYKTKNNPKAIIIVPISGHNEEAEFLLRSAATKIKWMPSKGKQKIICLDCGMDEETRRICNIISDEYNFMDIYTEKEFEENLKELRNT